VNVDELMNANVESCSPDANVAEAATIMSHYDCGAVPVVDDGNKVIGVITDRDICIATATSGRLATEIKVKDVITGGVYSCRTDDDIHDALEIMREYRVRRLPVVDIQGRLEGLLTITDVILHTEPGESRKSAGVTCAEVTKVLRSISAPRFEPSQSD
jgi:CBS domain-containing protein